MKRTTEQAAEHGRPNPVTENNSSNPSTLRPHISSGLPSCDPEQEKKRGRGRGGRSGPPGNSNARTHGAHTLKRAVRELGGRVVDRRTALGKALAAWRADLIADLGGEDAVSTQRLALVDMAVRTKLLVDSVDAFVLGMDSPVNKKKRTLHPVVRERQALVGQLQSLLRDLGLERKAREVKDLSAYLAARAPVNDEPESPLAAVAVLQPVESAAAAPATDGVNGCNGVTSATDSPSGDEA